MSSLRTALRFVLVILLVALGQQAHAASFTPGNIVVYRVGDGVAALTNNGNAVFIDEYTPAGAFVQAHGGRLDIKSTLNVGTTVRFSMPSWMREAEAVSS